MFVVLHSFRKFYANLLNSLFLQDQTHLSSLEASLAGLIALNTEKKMEVSRYPNQTELQRAALMQLVYWRQKQMACKGKLILQPDFPES